MTSKNLYFTKDNGNGIYDLIIADVNNICVSEDGSKTYKYWNGYDYDEIDITGWEDVTNGLEGRRVIDTSLLVDRFNELYKLKDGTTALITVLYDNPAMMHIVYMPASIRNMNEAISYVTLYL
jgi:hypothetical protein